MRIAEVVSVAPHPKADRLRVCQVDAGGVATVKVVTNAQNVEEGMKVVFAVSGCAAAAGMGGDGRRLLMTLSMQHGGGSTGGAALRCIAVRATEADLIALCPAPVCAAVPTACGLHHPQRHAD
jgi:predicted RNA-binding protein with EMAP domain